MREPPSICMFSNLFPPVYSGSATQCFALSRELVKRGLQVSVITIKIDKFSPDYEIIDGIHIYRLPGIHLPQMAISLSSPWLTYSLTPGNIKRIETILERNRPDILHLHNHMLDLAFSSVIMRKRYNIPLVITIHTIIKHPKFYYNVLLYPLDRLLLKYLVVKQADRIIAPDFNTYQYMHNRFSRPDTVIIPYGISLPTQDKNGNLHHILNKYRLNEKRVILSLGNVNEGRNRKALIEAMPTILRVYPNAILLIVGDVASNYPIKLAQELNLNESVIFTGSVPHHDISSFFELADLEAHWLSLDTPEKTSLGIASLEAMLAGKPILAAANENTYGKSVLRNGVNFIQVEPNKPEMIAAKVIHLLSNEEERRRIGNCAQQTIIDNFSWPRVCSKTLDLYQEVIRK